MALVKFKTNSETLRDSMLPDFTNLFHSFFNDAFHNSDNQFFTPRTDITENEKAFRLQLAIPGIEKELVKIDLKDNTLTISGEKAFKKEEQDRKYHLIENKYGKFSRSFTLPANVKKDEIQAEYKNGVLEVVLPKSEVAQPKTIEVK